MIIIQGMDDSTKPLPRLAGRSLRERLRVMPAVVVSGARQSGKSTLVQDLIPGKRRYLTLDDLEIMDAASRDPQLLLGTPGPVTLDEVQRVPELLRAVKRAIDRSRTPGRFLLTGSANLLLMHKVSESLAGRASHLTLWPMTRREQQGLGRCGIWEELLATPPAQWPELIDAQAGEREDWRAVARRGGFPTPALHLSRAADRAIWFDGYVRTYLERDLQELSAVSSLPDFRRVMRAACHRLGQLVNQSEVARDVALSQPTVHRYLNLLETSYLLVRLPVYAVNPTKRLIKSPKLYWGDTGVALHLAEGVEPGGAHLENLVLLDLLAWRDARSRPAGLFHWRTTVGEEVDLVIEADGSLLPIEVKASGRPRLDDTRHLRSFAAQYPKKVRASLLLHTGSKVDWIAPQVLAAPWWKVL